MFRKYPIKPKEWRELFRELGRILASITILEAIYWLVYFVTKHFKGHQ